MQAVEDQRKEIVKRRLKAEATARTGKSAGAQEFEDTLCKLADLAKDKVKDSEFTANDRTNVLDLFVNHETVLIKMYEAIFPGQNSFQSTMKLKNPSDQITIGTENLKARYATQDSIMSNMSQDIPSPKLKGNRMPTQLNPSELVTNTNSSLH